VAIRESYAQCETVQSASNLFTMGMVTAVYERIEWVQRSTAKPQTSKMLPDLGMRDSKVLRNKE